MASRSSRCWSGSNRAGRRESLSSGSPRDRSPGRRRPGASRRVTDRRRRADHRSPALGVRGRRGRNRAGHRCAVRRCARRVRSSGPRAEAVDQVRVAPLRLGGRTDSRAASHHSSAPHSPVRGIARGGAARESWTAYRRHRILRSKGDASDNAANHIALSNRCRNHRCVRAVCGVDRVDDIPAGDAHAERQPRRRRPAVVHLAAFVDRLPASARSSSPLRRQHLLSGTARAGLFRLDAGAGSHGRAAGLARCASADRVQHPAAVRIRAVGCDDVRARWDADRQVAAALFAGFIFAFLPYRFMHYAHLELQMSQWMPLCLWRFTAR